MAPSVHKRPVRLDDQVKSSDETVELLESRRRSINADPRNDEDSPYNRQKKSSYVDSYFKDKRFSGEDDESIEHLIRDFDTCSKNYFLLLHQKSLFFIQALAGDAKDSFHDHLSDTTPYKEIVKVMREECNPSDRQAKLLSQMELRKLDVFMKMYDLRSERLALKAMAVHISKIVPQLDHGHNQERHKVRLLRNALLDKSWTDGPISQI